LLEHTTARAAFPTKACLEPRHLLNNIQAPRSGPAASDRCLRLVTRQTTDTPENHAHETSATSQSPSALPWLYRRRGDGRSSCPPSARRKISRQSRPLLPQRVVGVFLCPHFLLKNGCPLLDDDNAMIAANFVRGKTASGEEEEPASSWLGCLNCIADIDASLFLNPFQLMVRWTQISKLFSSWIRESHLT
jgi:hypothetical protein